MNGLPDIYYIEYELFYYSAPSVLKVYLPEDILDRQGKFHLPSPETRKNRRFRLAQKLYWNFRAMYGLIEQGFWHDDPDEFPPRYFANYELKMLNIHNRAVVRLLPLREADGTVHICYSPSEIRPWNSGKIEEDRQLGYLDDIDQIKLF